MKTFWVEIDGQKTKVFAEKIGGQLWFHLHGQTRVFAPERKGRSASGAQASTHPGKILSPMPGKIVKALITVGSTVKTGQPVIIMEAMKMEYTLEADIDGVVARLEAKEGEQVSAGQCLVEVKAEENHGG